MQPDKTLNHYRSLSYCNSSVNDTLDQLLDQIIEQEGLELREDWPEVRKTVELFTFSGLVLESSKNDTVPTPQMAQHKSTRTGTPETNTGV